jgi:predicted amidohydrolase
MFITVLGDVGSSYALSDAIESVSTTPESEVPDHPVLTDWGWWPMTDDDTSPVRVTIAQRSPVLGDVQANLETAKSTLAAARAQDADLVVFPELFLTGYHIDDAPSELTERATEALEELRPLTDGLVVVVGAPTASGSDIYNSAVLLDDGTREGAYHKTHLFGSEPAVFTPGEAFPTFDTSVGTLGLEICYDVEFPEVARQLAVNGADMLVTISANMRPCAPDQALFHGTRALENGFPHVLCNRVGEERGVDFFGESGIVDRRGRRVLSIGADRSESTAATVDLEDDVVRHDYLEARRTQHYDL